jgi:putative transcriptional regulator
MTKQYKSRVLAAIHETAGDLYNSRLISRRSMKEFDALCLTPVKPLSPKQIRTLRLRENASQAVFARYLNVTTGLISQWERGEKAPRGASLKLLTLVQNKGLSSVE